MGFLRRGGGEELKLKGKTHKISMMMLGCIEVLEPAVILHGLQ